VAPDAPLLVSARALGHPLIRDDVRVANDVEVGPPGSVLLVTGSNMSGKSTLLRAIGVNVVLAQAGSVVCAQEMTLPPLDLRTSVHVHDSLEQGLSYFMAALARLKAIVEAARAARGRGETVLYLLDEILQGTNSAERQVAVRAIVAELLALEAIGAITTHDLGLADTPSLASRARPVHFTEHVEPDETGAARMTFDYRLRPGLATSTNALRLMQLLGLTIDPQ
jgi:DNA mismatch repair ATPase MutS